MTRFTDTIALITGGSSGMGLAAAARLRAEGAEVVITGRDQARLEAAAKELGVLAVRSDAADPAALDTLMETVAERYGRLDVVFANAGVGTFKPTAEVTEADFDHTVGVNLKAVFFTLQKAVPLMSRGGAIVINASWTLNRGLPIASVYAATKAAVHNLARTFAADLAARGIRVNSVSPGYIDTPMYRDFSDGDHEAVTRQIALGRLGTAEDVAGAVAFLASPDAAYITGQDIVIDGGLVTVTP
ncbi:glucose 1-dehydrogenase [Nonomuraea typhae]|uniref:glucose 1-dehydrogenase n=1 Tax=Nonomuraea typhae TaxID=2603600 RepID=UPI0012FB56F4|nr:glucose 1-dehydrogenase [Nonomuraea typhae]